MVKATYVLDGDGGMALTLDDARATVRFDDPQTAVAPGQAVVFYEGQTVLGGGWID